jgi:putative Holliday junction resolvase
MLLATEHQTGKAMMPARGPHLDPHAGFPKGKHTMTIVDLGELQVLLKPGQRLLGLDLGEKTIGLALSDTRLTVATPWKTLKRGKFKDDASVLATLIAEHSVGGFIVGLPLNMNGSEGPSAQSARAFARNFAAVSECPLVLVDERLSTAAVTRTLIEADASRRRRGAVVDKMAAAYILQGALDRLRNIGT